MKKKVGPELQSARGTGLYGWHKRLSKALEKGFGKMPLGRGKPFDWCYKTRRI